MRELYRAKDVSSGKWVVGTVHCINVVSNDVPNRKEREYWLTTNDLLRFRVDGNTLCQFTGQYDVHNNPVFVHDYIRLSDDCIVKLKNYTNLCGYRCQYFEDGKEHEVYLSKNAEFVVIGNFFDNPEMYKALFDTFKKAVKTTPKKEPVITMENYRDFGLYSKEDVLELIQKALSNV